MVFTYIQQTHVLPSCCPPHLLLSQLSHAEDPQQCASSCTLACPVSRCLVQPSPVYSHSSPAQGLLYLLPQRILRGYSRCLVSQTCLLPDQAVAALQGAPSQNAALMVTRLSPPLPLFQCTCSCYRSVFESRLFILCLNELSPLIHTRPLPKAGRQSYLASQTSRHDWLSGLRKLADSLTCQCLCEELNGEGRGTVYTGNQEFAPGQC